MLAGDEGCWAIDGKARKDRNSLMMKMMKQKAKGMHTVKEARYCSQRDKRFHNGVSLMQAEGSINAIGECCKGIHTPSQARAPIGSHSGSLSMDQRLIERPGTGKYLHLGLLV